MNENEIADSSAEILESNPPKIKVNYICEDCDYRWVETRDSHVRDSYISTNEFKLNAEHAHCPLCGSNRVSYRQLEQL